MRNRGALTRDLLARTGTGLLTAYSSGRKHCVLLRCYRYLKDREEALLSAGGTGKVPGARCKRVVADDNAAPCRPV